MRCAAATWGCGALGQDAITTKGFSFLCHKMRKPILVLTS